MNEKYLRYYQEYETYNNMGVNMVWVIKEKLWEDFIKEINEHIFAEPENKNNKRYILIRT